VFAIFGVNHIDVGGLSTAWRRAVSLHGVQRGRDGGWFLKLPDWRMAAVWVAAIALGIVIYFLPIARLLDSLTETGSPLVGEAPRGR
jgi:hypothetical protein